MDDEDYNERKIGASIAKRRWMVLNKERLDYDDYIWITAFFGDFKLKEFLPDIAEKNSVNLVLDVIDETANLSPNQIKEKLNNDIHFVNTLKASFQIAFSKWMKTFSPMIRESILAWEKVKPQKFEYLSPEYWKRWMTTGNVGVMMGNKGSGKTDFTLLLSEMAARPTYVDGKKIKGKVILTNIAIEGVPDEYDFYEYKQFNTFSDLLIKLLNNALLDRETLIIADEMTVAGMRKKRTMAKESLNLDEFDRLTRKFGADVLYIWHKDEDIPSELINNISFLGKKMGGTDHKSLRRTGQFTFDNGSNKSLEVIKGIPATRIKFKTKDISPFILDIPIRKVLEELTSKEMEGWSDKELFRNMKLVVEKMQEEFNKEKGE